MMRWIDCVTRWVGVPACTLLLLAAGVRAQDSADQSTDAPSPGVDALVAASNRLAWKLAAELPAEGNQLVAPLPLMMELRKLASGARGETRRELEAVSGVPESVSDADFARLAASVWHEAGAPLDPDEEPLPEFRHTLALASSLWVDERVTLDPSFARRIEALQGSPIERVDFRELLHTQDRLDEWVRHATGDQIREVILPDLDKDALGVIGISTLRLQAGWLTPYSPRSTASVDFYCTPERKRAVPMMRRGDMFSYAEDDLAQVVRHAAEGVEVLFLLPREGVGVLELERRLADGLVDQYRSVLELEIGTVRIPRFGFQSSLELVPVLRKLGVSRALDPARAQLFGTSKEGELVVARQQGHLSIDEEGLSAGSMTLFGGRVGGRMGKPPFEFTANRPFLIVIRHNKTGAVLFVGRYAGPQDEPAEVPDSR